MNDISRDQLVAARDRYVAAMREFAAAGQARLELFADAVTAGWPSLDAATALGITGLFADSSTADIIDAELVDDRTDDEPGADNADPEPPHSDSAA